HRKRQVRRLEPRLHRPDLHHRDQPDHSATRKRRAADLSALTGPASVANNAEATDDRSYFFHYTRPPFFSRNKGDDQRDLQPARIGGHSQTGRRSRKDPRPARPGDRRAKRRYRRAADLAVQPRPLPARGRAGAGQDADDQYAGPGAEPVIQPYSVHA